MRRRNWAPRAKAQLLTLRSGFGRSFFVVCGVILSSVVSFELPSRAALLT